MKCPSMIRSALFLCLAILWLPGGAGPARASGSSLPAPQSATAAPVAGIDGQGTFLKTFSLRDLQVGKDIRLAGNSADRSFQIGLSPDTLVQNALIRVLYRFHRSLFRGIRTNLAVDWNGILLGTLPYPPENGPVQDQAVTFSIPSFLMNTRNTLRFRIVKDPKNPCANFGLGSFVTVRRSTSIRISGRKIRVPERLSDLPFPFLYPSIVGPRRIPFVFGSTEPAILEAGGILSSGFGVLGNYLSFRFPVLISHSLSATNFPTGHLVLLAIDKDLPPTFAPSPIRGPYLALLPNPSDPFGRILLVSGRTPEEVKVAASRLVLRIPDRESSSTTFGGVSLPPPRGSDDAPRWLSVDRVIRFGSLSGPEDLTVHGTGTVKLAFSLPPDLFSWHRKWVPVHVHFRVRTLNRENRSRLDIFLNHRYQESLPLDPSDSGRGDRSVDIPVAVRDLTPFRNQLNFNFNFRNSLPSIFSCTMNKSPELSGTLMPDSYIDLRSFPRFSNLPDLRLIPNGGYPFTRYADLSRTAVILSDTPGYGDIQVFLHMMATFGAQTGTPSLRVTVVNPEEIGSVREKDLILIGTYDSNPLLLGLTGSLPWESEKNFQRLRTQNLLLELFRWNNPPPAHFGPSDLVSYFRNVRMPLGILMETASPYSSHHVALSLVGVSQDGIRSMDRILFDPRQFPKIFGDATVASPEGLSSFFLPGPSYKIGHLDPLESLRFWFYSHPIGIVVLVVLLAVAGGVGLQSLYKSYARRTRGTT